MAAGGRFPDWDLIHPVARGAFIVVSDALAAAYGAGLVPVLFKAFELYRSPADQLAALRRGTSKAGPYSSPHQFGLAVDFVPYIHEKWCWETADENWKFLAACARGQGLICQENGLEWDKAHVQHPAWYDVREALRPRISGVHA